MNQFDIFIAYVDWSADGKHRPVLIIDSGGAKIGVFNITTQYQNKSDAVKSKFFEIKDWQQAGLYKPSYVDTITFFYIDKKAIIGGNPIGKLTDADIKRLIEFMK